MIFKKKSNDLNQSNINRPTLAETEKNEKIKDD